MGPERKGLAFGWFNFAIGIAALPSSLIFGGIYQAFGAQAAFAWSTALALVAVAPSATVGRKPTSSDRAINPSAPMRAMPCVMRKTGWLAREVQATSCSIWICDRTRWMPRAHVDGTRLKCMEKRNLPADVQFMQGIRDAPERGSRSLAGLHRSDIPAVPRAGTCFVDASAS